MTTIIDEQAEQTAATFAAEQLTVAERLRKAIDESGMTQVELATLIADDGANETAIGSRRRLLNKWLAGTKPGRRYALRLATIFNTEPGYFLDTEPASGDNAVDDEEADVEVDDLAYAAAKKARVDIPKTFDARFVAHELARNFHEENILFTKIDQWIPLEFASGLATPDKDSLRLGEWYTDTPIVPGIIVSELLCQAASIALLTDPVYRKRVVLVGRINHLRIRRIVEYGTTLRVTAKLIDLRDAGRIAQYETWARLAEDENDLVAGAKIFLSTR